MKIKDISALEILDSRGFPTVACWVTLEDGRVACASVPSGVSVGRQEALELRDGDSRRYLGKGVLRAVENIKTHIAPLLRGQEPHFAHMDSLMLACDGTSSKSRLGANAILAVSVAVARAEAMVAGKELYQLLAAHFKPSTIALPRIMSNVLNGGVHADSGLCFQEFSIMPLGQRSYTDSLEAVVCIYHNLRVILQEAGYATSVGDEGGFAPRLTAKNAQLLERIALDFLMQAISRSGFSSADIGLCIDVAASQFYDAERNCYLLHGKTYSAHDLIDVYAELLEHYPIFSIEDGLDQQDWAGWEVMTARLGSQVQLVGDDIFVTNPHLIKKGSERNVANAVLIKPNQIGSVTETLAAMQMCRDVGYRTVVSHRSGETIDSFIADLAVGTHAGQFKAGAPRGERVAKYNRLLIINEAGVK